MLQGGSTESPTKPKGRPRKETCGSNSTGEQDLTSTSETSLDIEKVTDNEKESAIINNDVNILDTPRDYLRQFPYHVTSLQQSS